MFHHDRAAILSIGDELAIGQTIDTNSAWIADQLTAVGVRVVEHRTIPDALDEIASTIEELARSVPLIVVTGGLGPTPDDLTRDALARVMRDELVTDADAIALLERRAKARTRPLTPGCRRQAMRPSRGHLLPNALGTAPGIAGMIQRDGSIEKCSLFCLPGPPREMRPMFTAYVVPALRVPGGHAIVTRALHTVGMPEAEVADRLGPLMERGRNPTVGTTAHDAIVTCRLRFEGDASRAADALDSAERAVRECLSDVIWGEGAQTLGGVVLELVRAQSGHLLVVESCTAGLLGATLGDVPGASDVFLGGWITYANAMKTQGVGVPTDVLDGAGAPGAVSQETACAMATGAITHAPPSCADVPVYAVAITGIAGPGGGSDAKPVGTVWIACAVRDAGKQGVSADARLFRFPGDRGDVRQRSTVTALAMLRHCLLQGAHREQPMSLLWQVNP